MKLRLEFDGRGDLIFTDTIVEYVKSRIADAVATYEIAAELRCPASYLEKRMVERGYDLYAEYEKARSAYLVQVLTAETVSKYRGTKVAELWFIRTARMYLKTHGDGPPIPKSVRPQATTDSDFIKSGFSKMNTVRPELFYI